MNLQEMGYYYFNLRDIKDKTDREKEMLAGLEPFIYKICTTLVEKPSPWLVKFGEVLKAFHAGGSAEVMKLMDELNALGTPQ